MSTVVREIKMSGCMKTRNRVRCLALYNNLPRRRERGLRCRNGNYFGVNHENSNVRSCSQVQNWNSRCMFGRVLSSTTTTTTARCSPSTEPVTTSAETTEANPSCDIDSMKTGDFKGCSLKDLEIIYVDAVWNYYKGNKEKMLENDAYDQLKIELNYQASEIPDLSRKEVQFVEANIQYARGTPIMNDREYENLKSEIKLNGKKKDVTAMMLSVKGKELLTSEQFQLLSDKMMQMGIDVGIEGMTCTMTKPSDALTLDTAGVVQMYSAIGFIPTILVGVVPWVLFNILSGGNFPAAVGLGWTFTAGPALTYLMVKYMDLHNTEILTGACPCCEGKVRLMFSGENPPDAEKVKCPVCGATSQMNRLTRKIAVP